MATLEQMRTKLSLDFGDSGTAVVTNNEIDRALALAVEDLSRFLPREDWADFAISDLDVTDEAVTTNGSHGTAQAIVGSFIQPKSETVKLASNSTPYSRGVDYSIDYVTGTITTISTGDISLSSAVLITYKQNRHSIDISSITAALTNIRRVTYVSGSEVEEITNFTIHEDRLIIEGDGAGRQTWLRENSNIQVHYVKAHTAPTSGVIGTYPVSLDSIVVKGALAHLYLIHAGIQQRQAQTDRASVRTTIGNIAAIHTKMGTANTAIGTANTAANVIHAAMASLVTAIGVDIASGDTDYLTAKGYIVLAQAQNELAEAQVGNLAISFTALGTLSGTLASLGSGPDSTNLDASLVLAETALGRAATEIALVSDTLAAAALAEITTIIKTGMAAIWTELEADWDIWKLNLDGDTGSIDADAYLAAGDNLINSVNLGADAPRTYVDFANAAINITATAIERMKLFAREAESQLGSVNGFMQEAQGRIANEMLHVEVATNEIRNASERIAQAGIEANFQRSVADNNRAIADNNGSIASAQSATASNNNAIAANNGHLVDEMLAEVVEKINSHLSMSAAHMNDANALVNIVNSRIQQIGAQIDMLVSYGTQLSAYNVRVQGLNTQLQNYNGQIDRYTGEADRYIELSSEGLESTEEMRIIANDFRNEYFTILRERVGMRRSTSEASAYQPPTPRS